MSVAERYDRAGTDYLRYWAPVLEAAARRVLDDVAADVGRVLDSAAGRSDADRPTLLDVGTGAGVLSLEALRRWGPRRLRVVGTDASSGMLAVARQEADAAGIPDARLELLHGDAAHLPLADASADVAVSSFVYQLVSDRRAAFREALRILRPGGTLAFVTWLDEDSTFPAQDEFDEAVLDLAIEEDDDEPDDEEVAGDFRSPRSAASELRRAGFRGASARHEWLEYAWTLESYLAYKRNYGETALFAQLDARQAAELMAQARQRLEKLAPDGFVWRTRVVHAIAKKPH